MLTVNVSPARAIAKIPAEKIAARVEGALTMLTGFKADMAAWELPAAPKDAADARAKLATLLEETAEMLSTLSDVYDSFSVAEEMVTDREEYYREQGDAAGYDRARDEAAEETAETVSDVITAHMLNLEQAARLDGGMVYDADDLRNLGETLIAKTAGELLPATA